MNTEYTIGKIRIPFASRARRRWFVGLFYAALAVICVAWCSFINPKETVDAWVLCVCMILLVGLVIVFTGIAGDMRSRGDEREMHRRDHAHYLAYRALTYVMIGAFLAGSFRRPDPLWPLIGAALRGGVEWPRAVLMAVFLLCISLPQAILMWTEPDMDAGPETAGFLKRRKLAESEKAESSTEDTTRRG
jgi:hypothetical protein